MVEPVYYSPEEVADILKVSRQSVYNWLRGGTLKGVKIGDVWRVRAEDLPGNNGKDKEVT